MNRWAQATPGERRVWSKLVVGVMRASAVENDEEAVWLFRLLGRAFGADAVVHSLIYLADRAASPWVEDGPARSGEPIGIEVRDENDQPCDIEELPYPARWSARMVAAAANRDHDALCALVGAAADDGYLGMCVPVLAQMAATTPVPQTIDAAMATVHGPEFGHAPTEDSSLTEALPVLPAPWSGLRGSQQPRNGEVCPGNVQGGS